MSNAPTSTQPPDAGQAAQQFFIIQELLQTPELARFYTDMLINSPTPVTAVRDRQGLSKSTAYKYANTLAELGVATELDTYEDGSTLWQADAISGNWTDQTTIELGPVIIAVYGATSVDGDLDLFVDRHGKAALALAAMATIAYLNSETTRHGIGETLDIPSVEAIAVTQAIEQITAVVKPYDPTLKGDTFEITVHDRAVDKGPYQRADE